MLYVMGPTGGKHTSTNGAIIVIADEQIMGDWLIRLCWYDGNIQLCRYFLVD